MPKRLLIISIVSAAVIGITLSSLIVLDKTLNKPVEKIERSLNSNIRVAVLNGCGRKGLASVFVKKLRSEEYDVVNGKGENADSFDFDTSVVLDRKGSKNKAKAVAETLGIKRILNQRSDDPYLIEDVVVILGRDWDTLKISKEDFID